MELIDELDKYGNKTGNIVLRSELNNKKINYAIVVCAIIKNNEILLQQRSLNKSDAGMWDFSAAGHVQAGETLEEGIIRELKEEINLLYKEDELKLLGKNQIDNKFFYYFIIKDNNLNINDIILQEEEVKNIKLASLSEVKSLMNKELFVKNRVKFIELLENEF